MKIKLNLALTSAKNIAYFCNNLHSSPPLFFVVVRLKEYTQAHCQVALLLHCWKQFKNRLESRLRYIVDIVELWATPSDACAHVPLNNQAVVWKRGALCFSDMAAGQIVWS